METIDTETLISSLFVLGFDKVDPVLYTSVLGELFLNKDNRKLIVFKDKELSLFFKSLITYDNYGVVSLYPGLDDIVSRIEGYNLTVRKALKTNQTLIDCLNKIDFNRVIKEKYELIGKIDKRFFCKKEIIILNKLTKKREEHIENEETMFDLSCQMNKLTRNQKVAMYAFKLDEYALSPSRKLRKEIKELEQYPEVLEYKNVRDEYNARKKLVSVYAKSINHKFRKDMQKLPLPNIFVWQGDEYVNIIDPTVTMSKDYREPTIITPVTELSSNRELRKFYNRVSYHYLEALSIDNDYSLENKKIGKIKIKKM